MTIFDKVSRDYVHPYGNENAAASFYKWLADRFDHADGYTLILDMELGGADNRQELPFPAIVVQQVDTTDPGTTFIQGGQNRTPLMFYIWCYHNKTSPFNGTPRLLRRMRDQVMLCIRKAGQFDADSQQLIVPPIILYDFSKTGPQQLEGVLQPDPNILQHYIEDGELLKYEMLIRLTYTEHF